jgi:SulP family sulfate permease
LGGDLYLYRLKDSAAKVLDKGGYTEELKPENIFDSKGEAISGIFKKLDRNICANYKKRIFIECATLPAAP